ncbi:MAG: hypothetical protein U1D30_10810 [Planctomycetota bacterium]
MAKAGVTTATDLNRWRPRAFQFALTVCYLGKHYVHPRQGTFRGFPWGNECTLQSESVYVTSLARRPAAFLPTGIPLFNATLTEPQAKQQDEKKATPGLTLKDRVCARGWNCNWRRTTAHPRIPRSTGEPALMMSAGQEGTKSSSAILAGIRHGRRACRRSAELIVSGPNENKECSASALKGY